MALRDWLLNARRVHGLVRRTQYATANTGGGATATATLTYAVDLANTMLMFNGQSSNSGGSDANLTTLAAQLNSTTTVLFTRGSVDGSSSAGNALVVEFWPGVIRSIERNTKTNDGTVTLAIPVGPNAFVNYLGRYGAGGVATAIANLQLTPPTSLIVAGTNTGTVSYEVVDLQ